MSSRGCHCRARLFGLDPKIDLHRIDASDIASKVCALKQMVEAGNPLDESLALSGLMLED